METGERLEAKSNYEILQIDQTYETVSIWSFFSSQKSNFKGFHILERQLEQWQGVKQIEISEDKVSDSYNQLVVGTMIRRRLLHVRIKGKRVKRNK